MRGKLGRKEFIRRVKGYAADGKTYAEIAELTGYSYSRVTNSAREYSIRARKNARNALKPRLQKMFMGSANTHIIESDGSYVIFFWDEYIACINERVRTAFFFDSFAQKRWHGPRLLELDKYLKNARYTTNLHEENVPKHQA
jgi:hypothetical protein